MQTRITHCVQLLYLFGAIYSGTYPQFRAIVRDTDIFEGQLLCRMSLSLDFSGYFLMSRSKLCIFYPI